MLDVKIAGGTVIDGSGSPGRTADVGIAGDRIAEVGNLADLEVVREIDARGLIVAPGFIDIHTHSDFTLLVNGLAESTVRQGITTIVTGSCGHGCAPIADPAMARLNVLGLREEWGVSLDWRTFEEYLERLLHTGVSINVLPLVGHGALRLTVMAYAPRASTSAELSTMCALLSDAMEAGAAGLSTGLEYPPGWHADQRELVALASVVGRYAGLYATHVRDRASAFMASVDEALTVAREAGVPVQMSHLAPRPYAPAGALDLVLERVEEARTHGLAAGIDTLIDPFGPSSVTCLLPPGFTEASPSDVLDRLRSPRGRQAVAEYLASPENYLVQTAGLDHLFFVFAPNSPEAVGLSLARVARKWDRSPGDVVCDLLLREGRDFYNTCLRHVYAAESDIETLLRQPFCVPMSDGVATAPYGHLEDYTLNRSSYGWTARFLDQYVRKKSLFTLPEAVERMTSRPAELLKLQRRGLLEGGAQADVVVFDFEELEDLTTDAHPIGSPRGIVYVLVNGQLTVNRDGHTGKRAGKLLGRSRD